MLELFDRWVQASPDALAVIDDDDSLTFAELDRQSRDVAERLLGWDVERGELVAVALPRSAGSCVAFLGVLRAGAVYLPLDPVTPPRRREAILDRGRVRLVVEPDGRRGRVSRRGDPAANPAGDGAAGGVVASGAARVGSGPTPGEVAYCIFTSGSTGGPKGVLVEHRGLARVVAAQARCFGPRPGDRVAMLFTPAFDASVFEMLLGLGSGATLVVASPGRALPGPPLVEFLAEQAITLATLTPSMLAGCPTDPPLPRLRELIVAGEPLPSGLVARWGGSRRMWNAYGPTEATIWSTVARCVPGEDPVPIGAPVAGVRTRVTDSEGRSVPTGVEGELWLSGPTLARGYLADPGQTRAKFVLLDGDILDDRDRVPDVSGTRWYRTGDRVLRRCDGALVHRGRVDGQVKLRGFRVELGEVDGVLAAHPGVAGAASAVDGDVLRAVVVARADAESVDPAPFAAALQDFAAHRLPGYMVPVTIVAVEVLPRTVAGKLDRSAVADLARPPAPPPAEVVVPEPPAAPAPPAPAAVPGRVPAVGRPGTGRVAAVLAGIWGPLLERPEVGGGDDFFELGGSSLLVARMLTQVRDMLGVALDPVDLFDHPTLDGLAARIETLR